MQEILRRLTPGEEDSLPSLLLRPPLRRTTQQGGPNVGLVRRLLGQVSVKGEDLLLQMGSDIPARYHRLRASIPGKLWRWKEVAGWQWTGSPEHINVLELRATQELRAEVQGAWLDGEAGTTTPKVGSKVCAACL